MLDESVMPPPLVGERDWPRAGRGGAPPRLDVGIYVSDRDVLIDALKSSTWPTRQAHHSRRDTNRKVTAHVFQGIEEAIGPAVRTFFEEQTWICASELYRVDFFDVAAPIYTRPRFPQRGRINGARIDHAIVSDGCIITHAGISTEIWMRRHPQSHTAGALGSPDDHARHGILRVGHVDAPSTKRSGTRGSASGPTPREIRERDHRPERAHRQRCHHRAARDKPDHVDPCPLITSVMAS